MDWLKKLISNLPLDLISEKIDELVTWWGEVVKDVPASDLPLYTYVGGSAIVLFLWFLVARILPRPLGGMSWIVLGAVLLTPGTSLGESANIAPACVGVVYSVLVSDYASALHNLLPIMAVIVAGLFLGFLWQLVRGAIENALYKRSQNLKARQEQEEQKNKEASQQSTIEQQSDVTSEAQHQTKQGKQGVVANLIDKKLTDAQLAGESINQAESTLPPIDQVVASSHNESHQKNSSSTPSEAQKSHQWWLSFRRQLQVCQYTYVDEDADTDADYISFPSTSIKR